MKINFFTLFSSFTAFFNTHIFPDFLRQKITITLLQKRNHTETKVTVSQNNKCFFLKGMRHVTVTLLIMG